MRTAKAVLALLLSASLALPASAQVRAAASAVSGSALPRAALPGAWAPPAVVLAPPLAGFTTIAPSLAPSALAPLSVPSAAAALPAVFAAESVPATEMPEAPAQARGESSPAAGARASAAGKDAPATDASGRSRWENFWSGAASRPAAESESGAPSVSVGRTSSAGSPPARSGALARSTARAGAAAMLIVPAPHEVPSFLAHAAPFMEAGGILLGAYVATRIVHPLTGWLAVKLGMDPQNLSTLRLGTNVALWIAAASAALVVGGASHTTLTAVFGAGGTILSFALGDILGNVIQGLNFLITRPFTVGAHVRIGDEAGTVTDVTLTNIVLKMDDGSPGRMRHAALADVPVIVTGTYAAADAKFRLSVPAKPKFKGAFGAIVKSLDRRFWLASAAFAALLAFPAFVPFAAAGWAATAVHWSLAGVIVWLTRRLDATLRAALDHLSQANGWRVETTVITHLAVSALLWAFGGGAALRLFGLSWMTLIASLGLTTFVIGLASKKFFGSVFKVLFAKPVKIGDRVRLKTISGVVVGLTLSHVVLKLDDASYELVPYAVVDAALVNNPLAVTSAK